MADGLTLMQKLTILAGTKTAIKGAIEEKGVQVKDTDTFGDYAVRIGEISGQKPPAELPEKTDATAWVRDATSLNVAWNTPTPTRAANGVMAAYCKGAQWAYPAEGLAAFDEGNTGVITGLEEGGTYSVAVFPKNADGQCQTADNANARATVTLEAPLPSLVQASVPEFSDVSANKTYMFVTSRGHVYVSGNVSGASLWHYDPATERVEKTACPGYGWQYWFESSNGDVFTSSDKYGGIFKVDGREFSQVWPNNTYWQYWFEDSKGNVFVSGRYDGVLLWDGAKFTRIPETGSNWDRWFEDSAGNVFVSPNSSVYTGIYRWNGSGFTQVYSSGYLWGYWCEGSNGDVFVASSSSSSEAGILKWNGAGFSKVHDSGRTWRYWFEDSAGNVFVATDSSSYPGIYRWDGTAFAQVCQTGYYWSSWHVDGDGNTLVSTDNGSYPGVYRWDGSAFVQVYSTGYPWRYWYVTADGKEFVSSEYSFGILMRQGDTFKQVYNSGAQWNFWAETSDGNLFVSSSHSTYKGILKWDGSAFVEVYSKGYYFNCFVEKPDRIIFIGGLGDAGKQVIYDKATGAVAEAAGELYGGRLLGQDMENGPYINGSQWRACSAEGGQRLAISSTVVVSELGKPTRAILGQQNRMWFLLVNRRAGA